jgi:hypothetical protein
MANMQPAPMTFYVPTPPVTTGNTGNFTVDLSQIASLVNRRFYRQGLNWAVSGIKLVSGETGSLTISKIPNTWVAGNAWKKAFAMWNKQQLETISDAGAESALAKFRDFKVHLDPEHVTAGFAANLLPADASGNIILPGEWQESRIVVPNFPTAGDRREFVLHMTGANFPSGISPNTRGIIEGYADSRAYPQSPDPVSPVIESTDNWMAMMQNDGNADQEILGNATDRNDDLPYDQVNYPGGETNFPGLQIHDFAQIVSYSGTNQIGTQRIKGGNFPCGLMRIQWTPENTANVVLQIELMPGPARGYLTEPMQEM